ncbi:MAG TPA: class I SAM-dependent methyltransferase [Bryobacteraceae bacterium]|nr:class I SAM-dependent methyltransferase [Bryobacteraceae bacterium]
MNVILDLIEAFRRSKTMFTAVRLGIFDRLEQQPQVSEQLARVLNLNADALRRLLDACVALGLLVRAGDEYHNTPVASRFLVKSSPHTLSGYINYSDRSLYALWGHLDDAVREGTNRWAQAFGSRDALFDYYFRDPEATASFMQGMHGFGQLCSASIAAAFDLSRFNRVVDLGGATGHLAVAVCERYPSMKATIFDLPRIEPFARTGDRIDFVAGDFFADPLPPGDLYALGRILHDWDVERIQLLLGKIAANLKPGGGILIVEALLNDDHSGPVYAAMQDLNMLVCTDGRERTFDEYRVLLEAAGFSNVQYKRTGTPVDAVFATK